MISKRSQFLFVHRQHLLPSDIFSVITTDRDTAMTGMHARTIEIRILGQSHQLFPLTVTLLKQGNSLFQVSRILAPFVVEHLLGREHLQTERLREGLITTHVITETGKLILMLGHLQPYQSSDSLLTVCHTLINDIQGQFTHMRLFFPLFLYIFNEFLALRSATLIESRIDRIFIRVDELSHAHAQQQRLTVTLGNTETTE